MTGAAQAADPVRRVHRLLAMVATAVLALLVLGPGVASAHAILESSSPAANSVLETGPDAIVLDFDESIDAGVSSIRLFDQSRRGIALGDLESSGGGRVLSASVPSLDEGLYAVLWRVTSADGHVVDGSFSFQVGTTDSGVSPDDLLGDLSSSAASSTAVTWALGVSRFLAFAGIVGLLGAALLGVGVPSLPSALRAARLSWVLAMVGAVGTFVFHAADVVAGGLSDAFRPSLWSDVAGTRTGTALLLRMVVLAGIAALLATWRVRHRPWWRVVGAVSMGALAVTYSLAGHASALSPRVLYVANDALHLLAIGVWVGGLVLLANGGRATFDDPELAPIVHRFSRASVVAVPVMVITGVVQAIELAGGLGDLTWSGWGRTLLVKVTLVVVLVVLGGVGRWLLRNDGPSGLRRGVIVEAVIGVVVLALAAALVAQPPREASAGKVISTTITAGGTIADVTVTPGKVGPNEIHMVLTPPGGNLDPVQGVTARMSLPAAGIPPTPVTVTQLGTNHYVGNVTLPEAGAWTLEIVVTTAPNSTVLLSTTIDIG